jgi:hypothetical protein
MKAKKARKERDTGGWMRTRRTPDKSAGLNGDFFIDSIRRNITEKLLFPVPHSSAFVAAFFMGVPDYMEQPMDDEGEHPLVKGDVHGLRFSASPFQRDYNIANYFTREFLIPGNRGTGATALRRLIFDIGERDYIRGRVLAEKLFVQFLYLLVVYEQDAYVSTR